MFNIYIIQLMLNLKFFKNFFELSNLFENS